MQPERNWLSPDDGVGWLAFSALSCMLAIVVAVLVAAGGFSRGPTYAEALQTYNGERVELKRLQAELDVIKAPREMETDLKAQIILGERRDPRFRKGRLPPADRDALIAERAKTDPAINKSLDFYGPHIAAAEAKIVAQMQRVRAAEQTKNQLTP